MPFGSGIIDKKNWNEFADNDETKPFLNGYYEANRDILRKLEEFLENSDNSRQFKKKIEIFYAERESFVKYAGDDFEKRALAL